MISNYGKKLNIWSRRSLISYYSNAWFITDKVFLKGGMFTHTFNQYFPLAQIHLQNIQGTSNFWYSALSLATVNVAIKTGTTRNKLDSISVNPFCTCWIGALIAASYRSRVGNMRRVSLNDGFQQYSYEVLIVTAQIWNGSMHWFDNLQTRSE